MPIEDIHPSMHAYSSACPYQGCGWSGAYTRYRHQTARQSPPELGPLTTVYWWQYRNKRSLTENSSLELNVSPKPSAVFKYLISLFWTGVWDRLKPGVIVL